MRPDLQRARHVATLVLLGQRLTSLRIDVTRLHYDRFILFDSMQHYCRVTSTTLRQLTHGTDCLRDGCTIIRRRPDGTFYIVLYNEDACNPGRRGFTLAHEVGHIYLDHDSDGDTQETEANAFAAQLLAPDILVRELAKMVRGPLTPGDFQHVFALSGQAAHNRIAELARLPRAGFTDEDMLLLRKTRHLLHSPQEPLVDF